MSHGPLLSPQPNPGEGLDAPHGRDAAGLLALDSATIEAIAERAAQRTAELIREPAPARRDDALVSAAAVADSLGCSRQWVYLNAEELGVRRLGTGPRPRLRFDLETARRAGASLAGKQSQGRDPSGRAESSAPRSRVAGRSPNRSPRAGSILAVRGRARPEGTNGH